MKFLTKKDWLLIGLFFILVLTLTSFAVFAMRLDETPYESMLGNMPVVTAFMGIGLVLFLPIHFLITIILNSTSELGFILQPAYLNWMPVFVAGLYSSIFAFCLMKWNTRKGKR
ncbi:hypothetical protein M0Q28_02135 [Patescibacteria group bacterium]|jgi:hypothetical protein|nr:hypothetical protein [Patescibacteria group bacterium]